MPGWVTTTVEAVGTIEAVVFLIGILAAVCLWMRGVAPALLRLGNGLAKRKIAIFAMGNNLTSLLSLLVDSKLFRSENIINVSKKEDIGRAEPASVFLVYFPDWSQDIGDIMSMKKDSCALIVYSPTDKGRIPDETMSALDSKRHTTVANFRGRLLNDIVASMITTSYEES